MNKEKRKENEYLKHDREDWQKDSPVNQPKSSCCGAEIILRGSDALAMAHGNHTKHCSKCGKVCEEKTEPMEHREQCSQCKIDSYHKWFHCQKYGEHIGSHTVLCPQKTEPKICVCGEPWKTFTVHRTEGPCYAKATEIELEDWEKQLEERFLGKIFMEAAELEFPIEQLKSFIRHHIHLAEERGREEVIEIVRNSIVPREATEENSSFSNRKLKYMDGYNTAIHIVSAILEELKKNEGDIPSQ